VSTRPSYKTFVVERPVAAPRAAVWREMLALVGSNGYDREGVPAPHGPGARLRARIGGTYDIVEETLSLEPPWRRCYEIVEGAPLRLYQGTTTLRDDGERCLLVWSYLADPGDDPGADDFLAAAQAALARAADLVAGAAERAVAAAT
jgi:hypothetical protein